MELSDNIKNKIVQYFETHSEEEVKEIFEKIGLKFEEKKLSYENLSNKEAYEHLQKEIKEYAEYLKEYTYHPYDKIEYFANILNKLNNRMWPYEL